MQKMSQIWVPFSPVAKERFRWGEVTKIEQGVYGTRQSTVEMCHSPTMGFLNLKVKHVRHSLRKLCSKNSSFDLWREIVNFNRQETLLFHENREQKNILHQQEAYTLQLFRWMQDVHTRTLNQ